jgi:hypothetical protein
VRRTTTKIVDALVKSLKVARTGGLDPTLVGRSTPKFRLPSADRQHFNPAHVEAADFGIP